MTRAALQPQAPLFAEDIRLVIWDLDETFWDGTLSEGGIRYRQDHHDLVITLAGRGIISAICSKNDPAAIEPLLRARGLWDHFIFPSIDWSPKGPRIRAMLQQIGLRAPSVLFLDDNAMNRAQAAHMNPGLNVASPALIPLLAEAAQLQGKPDAALTRLGQYKLKERKARAAEAQGGDTLAFLRGAHVRVCLEYDVEAHLDRAIELINRTNQLNFTKERLPEDPRRAREALLAQLAPNTVDAALIRVQDDFGDYGFAGFYLTERLNNARRLRHFCFSCRTLNMFIEHWTYAHLGQPALTIRGEVLSDPRQPEVPVDWITPVRAGEMGGPAAAPLRWDRIVARGGCDLASLMHYFALHSDHVVEEFNEPRNGQMFRRDHSAFLQPALGKALSAAETATAAALGYGPADFETALFDRNARNSLYFLSFWADADIPLYRHRETGLRLPYWLVGAQNHDLTTRDELRRAVARTDDQRARLRRLCAYFTHDGLMDDGEMRARYRDILDRLPPDAPVVLVLANERGPLHHADPGKAPHPHHRRLNLALRAVAEGRENVFLLDPAAHIHGAQDLIDLNHFKRPVYHRMYCDVLARLTTHRAERG